MEDMLLGAVESVMASDLFKLRVSFASPANHYRYPRLVVVRLVSIEQDYVFPTVSERACQRAALRTALEGKSVSLKIMGHAAGGEVLVRQKDLCMVDLASYLAGGGASKPASRPGVRIPGQERAHQELH